MDSPSSRQPLWACALVLRTLSEPPLDGPSVRDAMAKINGLLVEGKFQEVDDALATISGALSWRLLMGLLTVTLAASDKLKNRPQLRAAARKLLEKEGDSSDEIDDTLRGL